MPQLLPFNNLRLLCLLGCVGLLVIVAPQLLTVQAQSTSCVGDINGDRIVDLTDYTMLAANFLKSEFDPRANLNNDHIVDLSDYGLLVHNFLKVCDALVEQSPYQRTTPWPITERVEMEDFDTGGEGVAYSDSTITNDGNSMYRTEGVDLRVYGEATVIGNISSGEWVEYTVENPTNRTYELQLQSGTLYSGRTISVRWDGELLGTVEVPVVSAWGEHQVATTTVTVPEGVGTLRFTFDTEYISADWFTFTTEVSSPSPTPTSNDSKLSWAPPQLENPITITLGTGNTSNRLDDSRDYIIKLPSTRKNGGTTLIGGRNIVMIGGHISLPYKELGGSTQRAIYIKDDGGEVPGRVVHIEGILIDASADNGTGGHGDAIAIDADNTIVQVQNVRAVNLFGGYDTKYYDHTDLIQPWGGVKELRVDKFSGSTNYQGFQIPIDGYTKAPIGKADLRRVNMWYTPHVPNEGGYMLWLPGCSTVYPVSLEEVYIQPKPGRNLGNSVWPQSGSSCGVVINGNEGTWPILPVSGSVKEGNPPGGDFVPAGTAGVNYVSPGYQ